MAGKVVGGAWGAIFVKRLLVAVGGRFAALTLSIAPVLLEHLYGINALSADIRHVVRCVA